MNLRKPDTETTPLSPIEQLFEHLTSLKNTDSLGSDLAKLTVNIVNKTKQE